MVCVYALLFLNSLIFFNSKTEPVTASKTEPISPPLFSAYITIVTDLLITWLFVSFANIVNASLIV